ncbi:MAG: methyltransferase domain-containing protein [Bacteroidia bacterium]|nr:methyltransferase domain-containing protein [Bacteroidia bacterium]MDW8157815.1 methyltransferase domain-containing protein [Bacteroidia bacterium]
MKVNILGLAVFSWGLVIISCKGPASEPAAGTVSPKQMQNTEHLHNETDANAYMHQAPFDTLVKRFENPLRQRWQKPDKVIQMLQPLNGAVVADIGAGTGYFSIRLASRAEKVIAIDIDPQFIEYLQKEVSKNNYKNIEIRQTTSDNPGLKPNEVDKVLIVNTYHHIQKREAWLKLLKNGMKRNSSLYIVDFKKGKLPEGPPDSHKITYQKVIEELEKVGFVNIFVDTTTLAYQYIIMASTSFSKDA